MKKSIILILILFCFGLTSMCAFAIDERFLQISGAKYFIPKDWQLFFANQLHALNFNRDGAKLTWKNPVTGHGGYFIPMNTRHKNDMICRKLVVSTIAQNKEGKATYQFCKIDRIWRLQ